jgi:Holliday junction resolvasome RuvABC ATP-dependent DNA helicase subunit
MKNSHLFEHLVGQDEVKSQLGFFAEAQNVNGFAPFIMMSGAKGLGKTEFAKAYASALQNRDGSKRPFLEINCSTIRNANAFFEQIFMPIVMHNEITILMDEAHMLPKDLVNAFLTVFNTEKSTYKEFNHGEQVFPFDFTKQNFIFATTELDKLFAPFKDRLTIIDFRPYSTEELAKIMQLSMPEHVSCSEDILQEVADTTRGNARSAVKRAREIALFCEANKVHFFNGTSWKSLREVLDIKPMGLSNIEVEILKILSERGACSLQMLSAITGMSRTAIQREAEIYLLKRGLMKINGQREISGKGINVIGKIIDAPTQKLNYKIHA